jgi:hypothetical protein
MTQRVFDVENEKDMADLWDILPDETTTITPKNELHQNFFEGNKIMIFTSLININWHDKTKITRPIQEATEQDIGKICVFWDDSDGAEAFGKLSKIYGEERDNKDHYKMSYGGWWKHCRRLTNGEVGRLCL